jgi:DNA-directed RNA polymerase specialized sigma subunit
MLASLEGSGPGFRLANDLQAKRDGLLAESIRGMAHELGEYERTRIRDIDEVLDRSIEFLCNRLGRCPTAHEVATAGGMTIEEVLEGLEASAARESPRSRQALALRCEGYDRDEIAERLGVCRCGVSRLLRSALRTPTT